MIKHIKSHTGLRGLLALLVTTGHMNLELFYPSFRESGVIYWFNGAMAVDLFFVLSGFVLCLIYSGNLGSFSAVNKYITARVARIFPLHLACLIAVYGMSIVALYAGADMGTDYNLKDFFFQALLIHKWPGFNVHPWIITSWSVSLEWLAYLLFFPLFLWSAKFIPPQIKIKQLLIGAYLFMAINYATYYFHYEYDFSRLSHWGAFFRCLGGFVSGCFLSYVYKRKAVVLSKVWDDILFGIILLSCILHVVINQYCLIFAYLAIPVWVLHLAYERDSYTVKLLQSKLFIFLGIISYSLYLIHPIIGKVVYGMHTKLPNFPGWTYIISIYVILIAISFAAYKLLEIPARDAIRKATSK